MPSVRSKALRCAQDESLRNLPKPAPAEPVSFVEPEEWVLKRKLAAQDNEFERHVIDVMKGRYLSEFTDQPESEPPPTLNDIINRDERAGMEEELAAARAEIEALKAREPEIRTVEVEKIVEVERIVEKIVEVQVAAPEPEESEEVAALRHEFILADEPEDVAIARLAEEFKNLRSKYVGNLLMDEGELTRFHKLNTKAGQTWLRI